MEEVEVELVVRPPAKKAKPVAKVRLGVGKRVSTTWGKLFHSLSDVQQSALPEEPVRHHV